jgi:hypothetical protein
MQRPLRACQPRDLIEQVTALCRYRNSTPRITRETLDAACAAYFVDQSPQARPADVRQPRRAHDQLEAR